MDFCSSAVAIGKAGGRYCRWRIVIDVSRVGVAGPDSGVANRNVAADGARLSSHTFVCSNCEPRGGSAYRGGCPTRLSNVGLWIDFPDGGQASIGSTCMADGLALARCAAVRAFSELELPDSRAAILVDYVVFCRGHSAGRRDAVEAPAEENHALGIAYGIYGVRSDDCDLSVWGEVDQGQAGAYGSRCRPGRFAFVVSPGGKTLLIDGGGAFGGFPGREEHNGVDPGEEAVSPYLWSRGFQKLDVVALTHAHQDHAGGLLAILENFQVGRVWIGREVSSRALLRLEELAREQKIPIEHELRGKTIHWDGVEGDFLWPEIAPEEVAPSAKNNDSLVVHLQFGSRSILLPGDAEKQVEREILSENSAKAMHSDVLKIGHHGSKNSTMTEFLAAVRPRFGIISVGEDNPYGHPSPELLERLENAGMRVFRTDRDGAVHVLTDGTRLEITCFVACPATTKAAVLVHGEAPPQQQNEKKE